MSVFGPPAVDPGIETAATKAQAVKQPTLHPTDKLTGVEHGGILSLLVVGILVQFGIEPNPYLAAGIGGFSAWLVGYMTKERSKI